MSTVYGPGKLQFASSPQHIDSAILEQLPDFVFIVAKDFSIRYTNTSFERQFGSAETCGFCYGLLQGRGEPCPDCPMLKVLFDQQEQAWKWEDGHRGKVFELRYMPYSSHSGETLALGFGHDVTHKSSYAPYAKTESHADLVRICSYCKSIDTDHGKWRRIETYLTKEDGLRLTHGICPDCVEKHHPEVKFLITGDTA